VELRDRFHGGIAWLTTSYPRTVVIAAVLVTAALGRIALTPLRNIDTDILNQLPQEMAEIQAYRRAVKNFGTLDHLFGVIETNGAVANAPLLIDAAQQFSEAIRSPEFVFEVQWSLDPDTQTYYRAGTGISRGLLLPADQWRAVEQEIFSQPAARRTGRRLHHLIRSPLPRSVVEPQIDDPWRLSTRLRRRLLTTRGPVSFDPASGHFLSPDSQMLLVVIRPLKPSTDLIFAQELMQHLDRAADQVVQDNEDRIRIGFLGPHAEALYDTRLLRQDVLSTAAASGLCVILLFITAFRRLSAILFVGVPLALGIVWTLGLVALFIGHLTIVTCAFAAIVLGLGIDFGIHLYNRFLEDRLENHPTRQSVRTALVEVGPGVFTGAVTTALAFFALLLTDFPGFRELGLIGGTGVLCCLLAMYLAMPSLLMVLHSSSPRSRYRHLTSFGLEAVADAVSRRPRATLLVTLLLTAWLGYLTQFIKFDDDLFHLRELPVDQVHLRNRVANRFRLPGQPLLVTLKVGPDFQAALEANDALSRRLLEGWDLFDIAAIDSLRTLLSSEAAQETTRAAIASLDVEAIAEQFRGAAEQAGLSPLLADRPIEHLALWKREALEAPSLRLNLASPPSLRRLVSNYVTHPGDEFHVMTSIFPEHPQWRSYRRDFLIADLRQTMVRALDLPPGASVPMEFTGVTELVEELRELIKRDLALTVFVVTLGVVILLWIHFRSVRHALLVTVPPLVAVLWTLGLMAVTGHQLNFINVLALPIIIGLGIDNGLHILERLHRTPHRDVSVALVKTGRAVVITSLSTILGFGALSLASFRGIQQMGVLALVGVALSLVSSITLIPALVETMGGRAGWRGLMRTDRG
jgi:predicted RND superfamily exporter protein